MSKTIGEIDILQSDIKIPRPESKFFPYDKNFIYHVTGSLGGYVVEVLPIDKTRCGGSITLGTITNMPEDVGHLEMMLIYED